MTKPKAPIGMHLNRVARIVGRAFDDALAEAGGSLPMWLVLLNLTINPHASQRQLADAVGVREPTVTQQLNSMERDGLLIRRRDPNNRRVHQVEVTESGRQLFLALRAAAMGFDTKLRRGMAQADIVRLEKALDQLVQNVD